MTQAPYDKALAAVEMRRQVWAIPWTLFHDGSIILALLSHRFQVVPDVGCHVQSPLGSRRNDTLLTWDSLLIGEINVHV